MALCAKILRQYSKFSYDDVFGIRNQISIIVRTACVFIIVELIIEVLLFQSGRYDLSCFWAVTSVAMTTSLTYIDGLYVVKHNDNFNNPTTNCNYARRCKCTFVMAEARTVTETSTMSKHSRDQENEKKDMDIQLDSKCSKTVDNITQCKQTIKVMKHWSQVISTSIGYELFIDHLEKEFSVETMLFITKVCDI